MGNVSDKEKEPYWKLPVLWKIESNFNEKYSFLKF